MIAGLEAAELPADAIEVGRIADAWVSRAGSVLPYSAAPRRFFFQALVLLPAEKGPDLHWHSQTSHQAGQRACRYHCGLRP